VHGYAVLEPVYVDADTRKNPVIHMRIMPEQESNM